MRYLLALVALALGLLTAISCDASQQNIPTPQEQIQTPPPQVILGNMVFVSQPLPGYRPVCVFVNGRPYCYYLPASKARVGGLRGLIFGNVYRY